MRARCLALALAAVLGSGASARAAVITVTSLADNTILDGRVTLREAILAANTDTSVDGSVAGSGRDEIVFATGPGVITLNGTQLPIIRQPLAIIGPGAASLFLDGAHLWRILAIASTATVDLSGLTILNGRLTQGHGAGIYNSGTLSIVGCVLYGNAAVGTEQTDGAGGAILSDGALSVVGSVFAHNSGRSGGAIWSLGPLSIEGSTFSDNSAQSGGAVQSYSALEVRTSTFERNVNVGVAPFLGGGGGIVTSGTAHIDSSAFSSNLGGSGGAIASVGQLTLTNSTLTGNGAFHGGGAVWANDGSVTVTGCTITQNYADADSDGSGGAGGIDLSYTVPLLLHGTIVARNTAAIWGLWDVSATAQASSSFNVIGVDGGLSGISHGVNGNQVGTTGNPLDPLLGPLQNNGGPTSTRALLPGSPALDRHLGVSCPSLDQRGVPRPQDGDLDGTALCDVGAYEAFTIRPGALSFFTVTPCRVVDTRGAAGSTGGPALFANSTRFFPVASLCGIPGDAKAVALNATVVNATDGGDLRLYPAGTAQPNASALNFVANRTRANNAVVPLGAAGQVAVQCDMPAGSAGTAHLLIDVYGYLR